MQKSSKIVCGVGVGLALVIAANSGSVFADGKGKKPPAKTVAPSDAPQEVNGMVTLGTTKADGECGAEIAVVLDVASFREGFKHLKIPIQGAGHDTYGLDDGLRDARSNCRYVSNILKRVCNQSEAHKTAVAAGLKTIQCSLLDDKDIHAAPQQALDHGTWTVKYTWWADDTADEPELGDPLAIGLAKTLGVEPRVHDPMDDGHGPEPARCRTPKDCSGKQTCRSASPVKGPRCQAPTPASCSKGSGAFGHEDAKCQSGERCSQYGVCFPAKEFPTEGHDLARWASCYLDRECASGKCQSDGMNRFSDKVGHCTQ